MKLRNGLLSVIIFLFYASFACAQEPYTVTTLNPPGAVSSWIYGISGNELWGNYTDANSNGHGFIYNISNKTYIIINYPGAVSTYMGGFLENIFAGSYTDVSGNTHGFLYNISNSTYTTFDVPGATEGLTVGFSGKDIWGMYMDANMNFWGYFATPTGAKAPLLTSVSPTSGTVGLTVTIKGSSFGSAQGSSAVSFNGIPGTTYPSWSNTVIQCDVPAGATTGPVTVTTTDGVSNGENFTVNP